jgi:hypothetical protein
MERRVMTTNQLSTVITALQLGRKTGLLTIERGEGATFEEGIITFRQGQAVQARIGPYVGSNVAAMLTSWQACRFLFVPLSADDSKQTTSLLPPAQAETGAVTEHTHTLSHDNSQTPGTAEDEMNYCPSMVLHHASLDAVLHLLDRKGFSRLHRRLFLLIDGQRSVKDLAALIGRTPDETRSLLSSLWQADLIQLSKPSQRRLP